MIFCIRNLVGQISSEVFPDSTCSVKKKNLGFNTLLTKCNWTIESMMQTLFITELVMRIHEIYTCYDATFHKHRNRQRYELYAQFSGGENRNRLYTYRKLRAWLNPKWIVVSSNLRLHRSICSAKISLESSQLHARYFSMFTSWGSVNGLRNHWTIEPLNSSYPSLRKIIQSKCHGPSFSTL